MIKASLFANQEREAKLNQLGDALQVMEQHVVRPPFPTELMVCAVDPAAIQLE